MKTTTRRHRPFLQRNSAPIHKQRGVVLFIALIILTPANDMATSTIKAMNSTTPRCLRIGALFRWEKGGW